MIPEFLTALASFDLQWLVWIITHNIFWLFAFIALVFFFYEGKHLLLAFTLLTINVWSYIDLTNVLGWVLLAGGFLSIMYVSRVAVLAFAEADPRLKKHLVLIMGIQFIVLWILYNIFIGK